MSSALSDEHLPRWSSFYTAALPFPFSEVLQVRLKFCWRYRLLFSFFFVCICCLFLINAAERHNTYAPVVCVSLSLCVCVCAHLCVCLHFLCVCVCVDALS